MTKIKDGMKKAIIFSAPSGSGKTTIINHLLKRDLGLEFSISATNREPRGKETDGREYYFLGTDEFRAGIEKGDFLEWEEVYPGRFYGTLKSELERIWKSGHTVVFDVDVIGGLNIKKYFGSAALAVFIQAPSVDVLKERLETRGTETPEQMDARLAKARYEMGFASEYDAVIVNDRLEKACEDAENLVRNFLCAD